MLRLELRKSSILIVLSVFAVSTRAVQAQPVKMSFGDRGQQAESDRLSLEVAAFAPPTPPISLHEAEDLQPQAAPRGLHEAQTVRMSLEDGDLESERARMTFSDGDVSVLTSMLQEEGGVLEEAFPIAGPTHWLTAGYLMMWTKGSHTPELVTTSTTGTPRADAGVVGLSSTSVLFGNEYIDDGHRNGLRLNYGHWLFGGQSTAVEADYFSAFDDASSGDYYGASTGTPILARPFYNTSLFSEDAQLVAFPSVVEGAVNISNTSEGHSVAVLLRRNARNDAGGRVDVLSGYRHFRYRDGIRIQEQLVSTDPVGPIIVGTTFDIYDQFRAENEFHGGEFGIHSQVYRGRFTCAVLAKIAVGRVKRDVLVDGQTTIVTPGAFPLTTVSDGGLLAQPTNMGRYTSKKFAALPELGVSATMAWTDRVSLQAGYTVLWLNDVVRSAEIIDRRVNPTQLSGGTLVGDPSPTRLHNDSDFWMQGLSLMILIEG